MGDKKDLEYPLILKKAKEGVKLWDEAQKRFTRLRAETSKLIEKLQTSKQLLVEKTSEGADTDKLADEIRRTEVQLEAAQTAKERAEREMIKFERSRQIINVEEELQRRMKSFDSAIEDLKARYFKMVQAEAWQQAYNHHENFYHNHVEKDEYGHDEVGVFTYYLLHSAGI